MTTIHLLLLQIFLCISSCLVCMFKYVVTGHAIDDEKKFIIDQDEVKETTRVYFEIKK